MNETGMNTDAITSVTEMMALVISLMASMLACMALL